MMQQGEQYQQQIDYIKRMYPKKKANIKGYGLVSLDAISNHADLHGIINNHDIHCAYCDKKIVDDWIVILHNPKEKEKPINVLFFCHKEQCAIKWQSNR
ncbi:hypothetical protein JW968_00200 [Candidatus Woesearchaeota archaeon]|nr:hypothetical protein [Candidatus Woesearchaeota archaeon]